MTYLYITELIKKATKNLTTSKTHRYNDLLDYDSIDIMSVARDQTKDNNGSLNLRSELLKMQVEQRLQKLDFFCPLLLDNIENSTSLKKKLKRTTNLPDSLLYFKCKGRNIDCPQTSQCPNKFKLEVQVDSRDEEKINLSLYIDNKKTKPSNHPKNVILTGQLRGANRKAVADHMIKSNTKSQSMHECMFLRLTEGEIDHSNFTYAPSQGVLQKALHERNEGLKLDKIQECELIKFQKKLKEDNPDSKKLPGYMRTISFKADNKTNVILQHEEQAKLLSHLNEEKMAVLFVDATGMKI